MVPFRACNEYPRLAPHYIPSTKGNNRLSFCDCSWNEHCSSSNRCTEDEPQDSTIEALTAVVMLKAMAGTAQVIETFMETRRFGLIRNPDLSLLPPGISIPDSTGMFEQQERFDPIRPTVACIEWRRRLAMSFLL